MKPNMGSIDRIIRLGVAAVLAFLVYNGTLTGTLSYVGGAVAAIFALTSVISFCPIYTLLGINTCSRK
jgi:hypothetical protein